MDLAGLFTTPSPLCKPDIQLAAEPSGSFAVSSLIKLLSDLMLLEITTNQMPSDILTFRVTATYMKSDASVMQTKYQIYKLVIEAQAKANQTD